MHSDPGESKTCSPYSRPARARRSPVSSLPGSTCPAPRRGCAGGPRWPGVDLVHLGTAADADEIKDTARTQPLLVAAALLAAEHLPMYDVGRGGRAQRRRGRPPPPSPVSLAGRGGDHAGRRPGPGDGRRVRAGADRHERRAGRRPGRGAGRDRGGRPLPGQPQRRRPGRRRRRRATALAKLAAEPPARARVIALQVAGAFHTPYMAPGRAGAGRGRRRRDGRRPGPDPRCRTWTARRSSTAARCSSAWFARSPRRCDGTCACGRWHDARRHRRSSSCRPPAPWPAWSSGSSRALAPPRSSRSTRPTTCPPPAT